MKEEYKKWYSPTLGRDFQMLVFGHYGKPVIVFPTSGGNYYEAKDFKLIDSVAHLINEGRVKIYCVDSLDSWSWYNKSIHPADRAKHHMIFDRFLTEEVVDAIRHEYGINKVAVAGASFGGYHAANYAFRHPDRVSHMMSMSGAFDIRSFVDGYYDENIYFNNPVDYMPDNAHPELWNMKIVLGYGEWDFCKESNLQMSAILYHKGIWYWQDERRWADHDWPLWRMQFPDYLAQL